jgi:hypothetical protein
MEQWQCEYSRWAEWQRGDEEWFFLFSRIIILIWCSKWISEEEYGTVGKTHNTDKVRILERSILLILTFFDFSKQKIITTTTS